MERNRRKALIARYTTAFRFCDLSGTLDLLSADKFVRMVREYGSDRILMGSNYPFRDPGWEVTRLNKVGLSTDELEAVVFRNGRRLLAKMGQAIVKAKKFSSRRTLSRVEEREPWSEVPALFPLGKAFNFFIRWQKPFGRRLQRPPSDKFFVKYRRLSPLRENLKKAKQAALAAVEAYNKKWRP